MKFAVLGGSPKGEISVTMQYVKFMQAKLPDHEFDVVQISSHIKKIEKDEQAFSEIIEKIRSADCVIWAFPLYFLGVPSQYKRFIELVFERNAAEAFSGKYAATLTTSIHYQDQIAHYFMQATSDDLGMKYAGALSPHMYEMFSDSGRKTIETFAQSLVRAVENGAPYFEQYAPLPEGDFTYEPGTPSKKQNTKGKKVLIVHDSSDENDNLFRMAQRLESAFDGEVELINLHGVEIKSGCLGCLQCTQDNQCVFIGKDDFIEFYESKIRTADVIYYCMHRQGRLFSSLWKSFFDRSFYNNHVPKLEGKQVGLIFSGPLHHMTDLRQLYEAYFQGQRANVAGIVTDEPCNNVDIDAALDELGDHALWLHDRKYIAPMNFLGIGGKKIFRDSIFGHMRFVFQADHRYFKKAGLYNFPTQNWRMRFANSALSWLFKIKKIRKTFDKKMKKGMIAKYSRYIDSK